MDKYKEITKLISKQENIAVKSMYKEILASNDPYAKIQRLCELSGLIAFYQFTKDNTHSSLKDTEDRAITTIKQLYR